ncbi:MAG: hypothetical protein Q9182_004286 [Xanthomendoza sp. 2 TL-2023]
MHNLDSPPYQSTSQEEDILAVAQLSVSNGLGGHGTKDLSCNANLGLSFTTPNIAKPRLNIILLGTAESGKSTIFKQLKIAYAYDTISAEDFEQVRDVLFDNLVDAFLLTLDFIDETGLEYERPETMAADVAFRENHRVTEIRMEQTGHSFLLEKYFLPAMERLWGDRTFQQALAQGNEYTQYDNVQYVFEHRKRLFQQKTDLSLDYQDFLHACVHTNQTWSECFETNNFVYNVFDVDGYRSGRKKWVHTFGGVECLLFVASLAGYDTRLLEDRTANQLTESLLLFESLLSLTWFKHTSIVLILNKLDIFKRQIKTNPLHDYDHYYVGPEKDPEAALTYIIASFKAQQRLDDERKLHIYTTNATDIGGCQAMLQDIEDNLVLKTSVGQNMVNDAMIGVAI